MGGCRCDIVSEALLKESKGNSIESEGIIPTRLCTHTADAHSINCDRLGKIEGEKRLPMTLKEIVLPRGREDFPIERFRVHHF